MINIETERLYLRAWLENDLEAFIAINQDLLVLEYLPKALSLNEAKALMEKFNQHIAQHGFGLYACCLKESNALMGYVGLNIPEFDAHFTPCVEIGWRLGSQYWGRGYATEAAYKVMEHGFKDYRLHEIVAFTVPQNLRSRRVMEKLEMHYSPVDDFLHPKLPKEHPLSQHVLYRRQK